MEQIAMNDTEYLSLMLPPLPYTPPIRISSSLRIEEPGLVDPTFETGVINEELK